MRYLMLMAAFALLLTSMAGCHWSHAHGVCDCEFDDYCSSRSPWVRFGPGYEAPPIDAIPAKALPGEFVAPPAKALPDVKKKDL